MNFQILSAYSAPLALIVTLALENTAKNKAENEARDSRKGGLVDAVKAYATATHADGVKAQDASDALRLALQASQDSEGKALIPAGTVKNYTAALRGFHVMLARGQDITEATTKDATDEVRSDEQKAIDGHKAAFRKLTAKYSAAQWAELVELVTPAAPVVADEAQDEGETSDEAGEETAASPAVAEAA